MPFITDQVHLSTLRQELVTTAVFALPGALSVSVPMLLVARLLLGLTIGVSVGIVPVSVAEPAPTKVRGTLLVA